MHPSRHVWALVLVGIGGLGCGAPAGVYTRASGVLGCPREKLAARRIAREAWEGGGHPYTCTRYEVVGCGSSATVDHLATDDLPGSFSAVVGRRALPCGAVP